MAENKTQPTKQTVASFLNGIEDEAKRKEAKQVAKLLRRISGVKPVMWGTSIVGYGQYHYKYASGREGDMCVTGLSPRKQSLVLYIMPGFDDNEALLAKLGKFKTGKSCLYINKLEDVHLPTLKQLIRASVKYMHRKYA